MHINKYEIVWPALSLIDFQCFSVVSYTLDSSRDVWGVFCGSSGAFCNCFMAFYAYFFAFLDHFSAAFHTFIYALQSMVFIMHYSLCRIYVFKIISIYSLKS